MGARFKTEGITLKKGDLIMALTSNQHVLDWVKEMEELMTPDKTIWIDGSEGQLRALREQAFATGELTELNQEELPGCVLHHTAKNDVARVEDRTFICTSNKADDCMMVNWMDPNEMKAKLLPLYKNVMAGRTMYVIPYCMGPIGSPFSKVGVEVTDSIYVVLNMDIMTRVGVKALRQLGDSNDFVRGQHARADIDPENRYIVQFPEDNAIWSVLIVLIWHGFGWGMLIYYTGIKNIDPVLYEAAAIDGADWKTTFLRITLPLMKPVIQINVTMAIISALKQMETVYLLTNGGPGDATQFAANYLYQQAFKAFKYGYGNAIGVVFIIICILVTVGLNRIFAGREND